VLSNHEGVEIPANIPHQTLNESDVYSWLHLRYLEFIVISQPPNHSDRILSDIIESSPS
jgi:hypothetical protein